jgi:hypothetical protein
MTVRALGAAVLVEGVEDLQQLKLALHARTRERRTNGMPPNPRSLEALSAVESALRESHSRPIEVSEPDIPTDSIAWIGAAEAAAIAGVTRRQITRIARSLDGRRVGARWIFPDESVRSYRDTRSERHTP